MSLGCKTTGTAEIAARFEGLRRAVREEITRKAVRKASRVMANEMKMAAPVLDERTANSTALEPGALKSSIRVSVQRLSDFMVRALIGPKGYASRVAHLVEYGHRLVKGGTSRVGAMGAVGSGKQIGDVPAHSFLRTSYEATAQRVLSAFRDEVKNQFDKVLR
jgi:HK97 gp10 family phage protein